MRASMRVDVSAINRLAARLKAPELKGEIEQLPKEKAVVALIAQAVADNFAKEGPGWKPLKAETIRRSLPKKKRKELANMSNEEILRHEKYERNNSSGSGVFRRILQRTRLLYKCVTTPGFSGSNKDGIAGSNIYKVQGSTIWWGTNLIYARAQNKGNPKSKVPARRFLILRQEWKEKLTKYVLKRYREILKEKVGTKPA